MEKHSPAHSHRQGAASQPAMTSLGIDIGRTGRFSEFWIGFRKQNHGLLWDNTYPQLGTISPWSSVDDIRAAR